MVVLSSSSPARQALLARLRIPFTIAIPNVDETPLPDESVTAMVSRLAEAKARAVAKQFADSLIIGCDQMLTIDNEILGKPHTHENAVRQLQKMSGKKVISYTGLCLLNAATERVQLATEIYEVYFKPLSLQDIKNYLAIDEPYQCAGSVRAEGLGIVLLASMQGQDPNALTGLPLIKLSQMLANENYAVLEHAGTVSP